MRPVFDAQKAAKGRKKPCIWQKSVSLPGRVRYQGDPVQSGGFFSKLLFKAAGLLMAFTAGVQAESIGSDYEMRRVADMFQPLSRPAEMIHESAILVSVICLAIFLIVVGLLIYILIRFRRPEGDDGQEPPQIYGSSHIELAWTVIPILITVVLVLVTSRTIGEIQNMKMPENALKVRVVGHQWWWEIHYPDLGIITANELHIPISSRDPEKARPTHLLLQSADVIHSFWVPQLAGKTDLIPNKNNDLWVEPYELGTYFGNCAEYCGTQHANMLLRVIVHTPEEFERWVAQQKAPVPEPVTAQEIEGKRLFFAYSCMNCHKVGDSIAQGVFGPDLTKLMTRQTIGAGVAPLNHETLWQWVRDPQDLKVGCLMPDMQLQKHEVDDVVAYLETLK
jgi:cytochrome c oxidase subunit 2